MASRVLLAPVPAITGTRLLTCLTVSSITLKCSSTERVADSPVVPTATMPSGTAFDMPVDQIAELFVMDAAVLIHGCNQGNQATL